MQTIKVKKILVRAPNWLGDALLATPALAALKELYPDALISVVAKPAVAPVFAGNPVVKEVLEYRPEQTNSLTGYVRFIKTLRARNFDLALLLPNAFSAAWMAFLAGARQRVGYSTEARGFLLTKSLPARGLRSRHLSEEYLDLVRCLGWQGKAKLPVFFTDKKMEQAAALRLKKSKTSFFAALACGAAYGSAKQWFPESFAEVGARLVVQGASLLLLGTQADNAAAVKIVSLLPVKAQVRVRNLCGQTTLPELAAVIKQCRVVVCNDSGMAHLSSALGVPTVVVFGSTSPAWTAPLGKRSQVVYDKLFCSPCFKRTCYRKDVPYECLKKITPDKVWAAVSKELA